MPKKRKREENNSAGLPAEIAGVPIGKELRSAVEPILRFARHPLVSEALSAALLAGADALADKKKGGKKEVDSPIAAVIGAATRSKGRGPVELLMAIAAGEIASRIVNAYAPAPQAGGGKAADAKRPASGADATKAKQSKTAAAAPKKGRKRATKLDAAR